MASDLLGIGTSGVLAQQRLLQTTSNNIVNVNSQGYVRERTLIYTNSVGLGTGDMVSERVINAYAQAEVRRDTSAYHAAGSRYDQLFQIDSLLGDASNSVGTTITSYFKAFHTANESPAEVGGRKTTLSELSGMVDRFHTLSAQLDKQSDTINSTIGDETDRVNSLLNSINDLNQAIIRTQGSPEENLMLFDQRDEAIRQLSEKMEVRTVTQPNGSMLVNMSTGHSLVLDGGVAQFKVVPGSPDSRDARLQLTLGANQANINDKDLGGAIGGLFTAHPRGLDAGLGVAQHRRHRIGRDRGRQRRHHHAGEVRIVLQRRLHGGVKPPGHVVELDQALRLRAAGHTQCQQGRQRERLQGKRAQLQRGEGGQGGHEGSFG